MPLLSLLIYIGQPPLALLSFSLLSEQWRLWWGGWWLVAVAMMNSLDWLAKLVPRCQAVGVWSRGGRVVGLLRASCWRRELRCWLGLGLGLNAWLCSLWLVWWAIPRRDKHYHLLASRLIVNCKHDTQVYAQCALPCCCCCNHNGKFWFLALFFSLSSCLFFSVAQ